MPFQDMRAEILEPSAGGCNQVLHGARDKHVIGARFRNIWPVVVVDEWTASPLRKNRFDRDRNST
jgi:hypothetical protein